MGYFTSILEEEYNNLSLWYIVSFISGIIFYFTLESEPSTQLVTLVFLSSLPLLYLRKYNLLLQFISSLTVAFAMGVLVGKYRVANLNPISIEKAVISKIDGVVESIKPATKGMQITLKNTKIHKLQSGILYKVRISVQKKYFKEIFIHDKIRLLTKLYKSQNAILPSGYNFGFYAYMAEIGATGYAMSDIEVMSRNEDVTKGFVFRIRKKIYNKLIDSLGSFNGNFAAAILLGETKGVDKDLMKDMRQSGISHILCVSGLHLSLVAMIFLYLLDFCLIYPILWLLIIILKELQP